MHPRSFFKKLEKFGFTQARPAMRILRTGYIVRINHFLSPFSELA